MIIKSRKVFLGVVLVGVLFATSCGAGASQEPTPDVAAIKTEAAMEVMAQLTVDAVLNPTATEVPPTMTPLPTATTGMTATPTTRVYYSSGGSSSSSSSSGTAVPTLTPDVYKCSIVSESPLDGPQMTGWIYDKIWTVKNTGIVTWDEGEYYYIWIEDPSDYGLMGDSADLSPKHKYILKEDVDPGDTIDIIVDVEIPTQPEDDIQVSYWALVNDNGDAFCQFNMVITYTYPSPTKTPND